MKTPKKITSLEFIGTCSCKSVVRQYDNLPGNSTKASGKQLRLLIKEHRPDLYKALSLDLSNPFESHCEKKPTGFVYVHSAVDYFFTFSI
jgi:hypothetical protein